MCYNDMRFKSLIVRARTAFFDLLTLIAYNSGGKKFENRIFKLRKIPPARIMKSTGRYRVIKK